MYPRTACVGTEMNEITVPHFLVEIGKSARKLRQHRIGARFIPSVLYFVEPHAVFVGKDGPDIRSGSRGPC
jgi:hypothetical protein